MIRSDVSRWPLLCDALPRIGSIQFSAPGPVPDDEISSVGSVRAQFLDGSQLAPPLDEVARGAWPRLIGQGILRLDQDEAVALRQRDGGREELTRYVVPSDANPDRNRERQSARECQARVFP